MSKKADELKLDIEELSSLLQEVKRQKTKDLLGLELRRLQTELLKYTEEASAAESKAGSSSDNGNALKKCYEVKLNNYGWDQSDKFVKLYVTLKGVETLPEGATYCNFTERSLDLKALGLENRNYHLPIHNLCEEIDTEKSYIKVKQDMIVVFLAKKIAKQWSHVTGVEKRAKEGKAAPRQDTDTKQDATGDIMNLMMKMYQDGDDDMKRIIAKAWTESQDRKTSPPDFPSL